MAVQGRNAPLLSKEGQPLSSRGIERAKEGNAPMLTESAAGWKVKRIATKKVEKFCVVTLDWNICQTKASKEKSHA